MQDIIINKLSTIEKENNIKKTSGLEIDIEPKSPIITDFLKSKIDYYEQYLKTVRKEKPSDYDLLNALFREILKEVWG